MKKKINLLSICGRYEVVIKKRKEKTLQEMVGKINPKNKHSLVFLE